MMHELDRLAAWCFSRGNGVFLIGYVVALILTIAAGALIIRWRARL